MELFSESSQGLSAINYFAKSCNVTLSTILDLEDDAILSNYPENDTQSIDNIDGSEVTETDSHGVPTDQSKIKKVVEPPPVQGNGSLR